MDESDLREYVERSQRLLEQSPQMNEDNTKARLVEPLLELLGWDLRSLEVEREFSMQIGSGSARADYALLVESTPVVFVEAKGSDTSLSESDEGQLSSYMRQVGVDWGLLTNGTEFEVLRRRNHTRRPDEISLGEFSLGELPEHEARIRLLSKESVQSGESDKIAERLEATRRAVRRLQEDKSDVAARVTRAITEVTGDEIAQTIAPLSKGFVDDVVSELQSETVPPERVERQHSMQTDAPELAQPSDSEYVVRISENGSCLGEIGGGTQADTMVNAVDWLIEESDWVERLDEFPYVPGKNAILSERPGHPNGEQMRAYGETGAGYFVNTNLNSESKQRYIRHFAEKCGLAVEFSEEW